MLKSLGLWKSSSTKSDSSTSSSSSTDVRRGLLMEDRFDERLEERYDEKSSSSNSSSPSLVPASSKKQDDGDSTSSDESSIVSQIHDGSKRSLSKRSSSHSRDDSSIMSTVRGSVLSQRMDSSETLKECTPLSYPRDTSMLLETAELFHSWEEDSADDSDADKSSIPCDQPPVVPRYPPVPRERKLLAKFSSSSIQNTSSGSVPLPFNGWQSSCDTTAHERPLSKLSQYQSIACDTMAEEDHFASRKTSGASHSVIFSPTSRQSSLVLHPHHRRQLSGGSKVSFQDGVIECGSMMGASALGSQVCPHIGSLSDRMGTESEASGHEPSESMHVTCARCNLEAFRNIRKPDIEEVKENLRKVPPLARKG